MANVEMANLSRNESLDQDDTPAVGFNSSLISLQKAVRDGRKDLVPVLLNRYPKGSKKLNAQDADGFSAIHYAARFNRPVILCQLLAARADTNVKTNDGFTALHFAARHLPRSKDTEEREGVSDALSSSRMVVRALLMAHDNYGCQKTILTEKTSQGITALHMACSRGNLPAVEELVNHDSLCVNVSDNHGDTPLHEACLQGNVKIVRHLLKNNADVLARNKDDETPLHVACKEGHADVVRELVKPDYNTDRKAMISARDNENNTVVHLAVESGVLEAVKVLLILRADPNAMNADSVFPIHIAAAQGYTQMAKVLLSFNGRVKEAVDGELRTPLHHAAMHGQDSMIKFLLQHGVDKEASDEDSSTPLLLAAAWGKANAVKVLLQGGAEVNTTDKDGKSAVYWAAQEGHVDVLKILLQHEEGLQLCSVTELYHQNTPLHVAAWKGEVEALRVIITMMENNLRATSRSGPVTSPEPDGPGAGKEGGEDWSKDVPGVRFDVRNDENRTPLHLASVQGHLQLVRYLVLKNRASLADEDEEGNTPLHLAAKYGQAEVADYLIEAGAEVEARNGRLWTPIDCAADAGFSPIISLLIDAEAPLDPKDKSSKTPLFLACRSGHLSAVQLLLESGADISVAEEETGYNGLDVAVENGHGEVALAIIKSDSWKEALRNCVDRETPMRRMIHKLPDVAKAVLDRCLTDNATEDSPNIVNTKKYEVTADFEFLEDWKPQTKHAIARRFSRFTRRGREVPIGSTDDLDDKMDKKSDAASSVDGSPGDEESATAKWKPEGFNRVWHPLSLMVKYNRGDLLRHPVVSSLLERKWKKYGRNTFVLNFASYLFFLLFLTLYALLLPHPDQVYCREYSVLGIVTSLPRVNETCPWDNLTYARGDPTVPMTFAASIVLFIAAAVIVAISLVRLALEFMQAIKRHFRYFLNFENYIEVSAYVLSFIFVIHFGQNCWCPTGWQWQIGALAVFLSWINLILFLKRVPLLGIYVLMYTNIVSTFLRVFIIPFLFVIAFSLAFYMILFKPVLSTGMVNVSPFQTPGLSIIKTMVMTIGEFEYDTIFGNTPESRSQLTEYAGVAYFLWIIFLITMSILLVNLLVGLAVDDTKAIQDEAHLQRIGIQVHLTLETEELWALVPRAIRPQLALNHYVVKPNRRLNPWEVFKDAWGVQRWDSVDNIEKYKKPEQSVVDHMKANQKELAGEIKELRTNVHAISQMIMKIAKKQNVNLEEDDHNADDEESGDGVLSSI